MRDLRSIFHDPPRGSAWKWPHYFPIYERHFEARRRRPTRMLEIGVCGGGSLWMWKTWFEDSEIIGIDTDPGAVQYEGDGVRVLIGDQADRAFLRRLGDEHGPFDIVLDDGGHKWNQQIVSLVTLFPFVVDGGLYVIEDLQNSYSKTPWQWVKRRVKRFPYPPTMQFLKRIVDAMHFRHRPGKDPLFSDSVASITFHEGVVVIEKGRVQVEPPIRSRQVRDPASGAWVDAEVDADAQGEVAGRAE